MPTSQTEPGPSQFRIRTHHWIVLLWDAAAVILIAAGVLSRGVHMLPVVAVPPVVILGLARVLMREAQWSQVAVASSCALSACVWYTYQRDPLSLLESIDQILLELILCLAWAAVGIGLLVLNSVLVIKLLAWKRGLALLLGACAISLLAGSYAHRHRAGFRAMNRRAQVSTSVETQTLAQAIGLAHRTWYNTPTKRQQPAQ